MQDGRLTREETYRLLDNLVYGQVDPADIAATVRAAVETATHLRFEVQQIPQKVAPSAEVDQPDVYDVDFAKVSVTMRVQTNGSVRAFAFRIIGDDGKPIGKMFYEGGPNGTERFGIRAPEVDDGFILPWIALCEAKSIAMRAMQTHAHDRGCPAYGGPAHDPLCSCSMKELYQITTTCG